MADKEFSDDILNNQNSAKNDYHCHGGKNPLIFVNAVFYNVLF